MKCNVGGMDRSARFVIGVVLVLAGLLVPMNPIWQVVVFVVAAVALVTAIVRFCPANALFGFNSCSGADKGEGGSAQG